MTVRLTITAGADLCATHESKGHPATLCGRESLCLLGIHIRILLQRLLSCIYQVPRATLLEHLLAVKGRDRSTLTLLFLAAERAFVRLASRMVPCCSGWHTSQA